MELKWNNYILTSFEYDIEYDMIYEEVYVVTSWRVYSHTWLGNIEESPWRIVNAKALKLKSRDIYYMSLTNSIYELKE